MLGLLVLCITAFGVIMASFLGGLMVSELVEARLKARCKNCGGEA